MTLGTVGSVFNIIKEIDLGAIKTTSERPFRLLVLGDYLLATEMATALSAELGKNGIHPWIVVSTDGAKANDGVPVIAAIWATSHVEPDAADMSVLSDMVQADIPVLTVVVSETAGQTVGAELVRRDETKRVIVPNLDHAVMEKQVVPTLVQIIPMDWRVSVGRQLPPLRGMVAYSLVEETSRANAVYATTTAVGEAIPGLNIALTAADMLILTKNQLVMAYKIALAAGKEGKPLDVMGEVAGVIGGGFLLRQLARELVGLIPVVGAIPKIAVAYAGTWVMGRTVTLWAMEGHRLNPSEARRFYDEAIANGRKLAENLLEKMKREEQKSLPAPESVNGTELVVQTKQSWWERLKGRFRRQPKTEIVASDTTFGTKPKRWWQKLPFFRQ
jgi:uncharacterized protein (DUF697 family)